MELKDPQNTYFKFWHWILVKHFYVKWNLRVKLLIVIKRSLLTYWKILEFCLSELRKCIDKDFNDNKRCLRGSENPYKMKP